MQVGWDARYWRLRIERFTARLEVCRIGGVQVDVHVFKGALEITASAPKAAISMTTPLDIGSAYASQGIEVTMNEIDLQGFAGEICAVSRPNTSVLSCCNHDEALARLTDSPKFPRDLLAEVGRVLEFIRLELIEIYFPV